MGNSFLIAGSFMVTPITGWCLVLSGSADPRVCRGTVRRPPSLGLPRASASLPRDTASAIFRTFRRSTCTALGNILGTHIERPQGAALRLSDERRNFGVEGPLGGNETQSGSRSPLSREKLAANAAPRSRDLPRSLG